MSGRNGQYQQVAPATITSRIVNAEYSIRELMYEQQDAQSWRFSPTNSSVFVNEMAEKGWRFLPESVFSVPATELRIGPSGTRRRVYATFVRPLGSGANSNGA